MRAALAAAPAGARCLHLCLIRLTLRCAVQRLQAAARAARWQAYKNLFRPGVHKKDIYWHQIETSPVMPSPNPVKCPGGYRMVRICCPSGICWDTHMQVHRLQAAAERPQGVLAPSLAARR